LMSLKFQMNWFAFDVILMYDLPASLPKVSKQKTAKIHVLQRIILTLLWLLVMTNIDSGGHPKHRPWCSAVSYHTSILLKYMHKCFLYYSKTFHHSV
jgi:hypothetical protein